jgi:alpha-L-arabinofuranosidase
MVSYAPLLAHVEAWQWRPDLIWFDNLTTIGTPNYYVQKLFSVNGGTEIVLVTSNGQPLTGQDGIYASSSIDRKAGKLYIKVVNTTDQSKPLTLSLGALPYQKIAVKEVLRSGNKEDFNSVKNPALISPVRSTVTLSGRKINTTAEPLSLTVYVIDFRTR